MQALLSAEQLAQLWAVVGEDQDCNTPIVTVDPWGDSTTIFDGWGDVGRVRDHLLRMFRDVCANVPERATTGDYPDIGYLIGEVVFSDQYTTCDHCRVAICMDDPQPDFWFDSDQGRFLCGDCLRTDEDFAADYLSFMARKLSDVNESAPIIVRMADPEKHGFVCVNSRASDQYCAVDNPSNHPEYDSRLTYADGDELRRLGRAAQLIDPNLQIVYSYTGGSNRIWARFADGMTYSNHHASDWFAFGMDDSITGALLGYALGLTFRKYGELYNKASK